MVLLSLPCAVVTICVLQMANCVDQPGLWEKTSGVVKSGASQVAKGLWDHWGWGEKPPPPPPPTPPPPESRDEGEDEDEDEDEEDDDKFTEYWESADIKPSRQKLTHSEEVNQPYSQRLPQESHAGDVAVERDPLEDRISRFLDEKRPRYRNNPGQPWLEKRIPYDQIPWGQEGFPESPDIQPLYDLESISEDKIPYGQEGFPDHPPYGDQGHSRYDQKSIPVEKSPYGQEGFPDGPEGQLQPNRERIPVNQIPFGQEGFPDQPQSGLGDRHDPSDRPEQTPTHDYVQSSPVTYDFHEPERSYQEAQGPYHESLGHADQQARQNEPIEEVYYDLDGDGDEGIPGGHYGQAGQQFHPEIHSHSMPANLPQHLYDDDDRAISSGQNDQGYQ